MELRIEEVKLPQEIKFNYEQLKKELSEKVEMYTNLVYSDDQIKSAKADRADLNRLKKALNDERIRREKEYMQPFNAFKAQINEIISIIDKPAALIDRQIKEYEEQRKKEKKEKIIKYFMEKAQDLPWLTFQMIFDEKWLNASVTMKSIQEKIDDKISTVNSDLATLSNLPEFSFEATETYKATLDLNKSIAEGHRLSEMQKRKAEQERIKTEQEKARAEQERIRREQEERARQTMPQAITEPFIGSAESQMQYQAKEEAVQSPKEFPTYVCFKALLTVSQARELKEFFESRNIEFSRI